jgi:hypothetical protein
MNAHMSSASHSLSGASPTPDVLGELLHCLCQPLTTLRCSLEFSLASENPDPQQETVSRALQQAEQVIGVVQLMREYLDAERPAVIDNAPSLAVVARNVTAALSSVAAVRGIRLRLAGTCAATLPLPEPHLRLALQYLIASLFEPQPEGSQVMLLLGEGPAGTVLRAETATPSRSLDSTNRPTLDKSLDKSVDKSLDKILNQTSRSASTSPAPALRSARLAIARRILENAGASLVLTHSPAHGFVLRIPR